MRRDDLSLAEPPPGDRPSDRWACGHHYGDPPCAQGPRGDGSCPLEKACRPRLTWHGRRRQIALVTGLLLGLLVFVAAQLQGSATFFKPGGLTTPHAQILAGTMDSQRCAACHPQAASSAWQWFRSAEAGHSGVKQSDRCLECHHRSMDRSTARFAHNLPPRVRDSLTLASRNGSSRPADSLTDFLPSAAVDPNNIECSVCHREHRGADADLMNVSDAQCQSCHQNRFGSFADSHPDWGNWPYDGSYTIAFDHATHARKHFPASKQGSSLAEFRCADCHPRSQDNEIVRSVDYASACASCHDQSLQLQLAQEVTLLALPSIPNEMAEALEAWPPPLTGLIDGEVAPLARLLLQSEPEPAAALARLADRSFGQLDMNQPGDRNTLQTLAAAQREWMTEFASKGHEAILNRWSRLGVNRSRTLDVFGGLSPQLVQQACNSWMSAETGAVEASTQTRGVSAEAFGAGDPLLAADAEINDLLDGDDLLTSDPLATDPLTTEPLTGAFHARADKSAAASNDRAFDAERMLVAGGWFYDSHRYRIAYRPRGHEDGVLKATVELLRELPASSIARAQLVRAPALAACLQCHRRAAEPEGTWRAQSQQTETAGPSAPEFALQTRSLTHFSHAPHVNIAQLQDCQYCHQLRGAASSLPLTQVGLATEHSSDFAPLTREACAACHTPRAAGDACITCHRYHTPRL